MDTYLLIAKIINERIHRSWFIDTIKRNPFFGKNA